MRKSIFIVQTCFYFPPIIESTPYRSDQQLIMSTHSTTDVGPYAMFGKRTSRTPQAKFRATLSLTHCHWDSTPRPLGRQSRALTTELERATCGKLRCRGPFSSFLTNPFICFECYSNIERINEGIISNAKQKQQSRIPETPLSLSQ